MPVQSEEMAVIRQKEGLYITLSGDGATNLICIGARVREKFSTISEMRLEVVTDDTSFDPKTILGKRITLETEDEFRCSGIVVSVEDLGLQKGGDVYAVELRPWFWMMTIGADNRVYQNLTTAEIIKKLCGDQGFTDIKDKLSGTYEPREYCVQYGESNFDFLSRLMEEDGIYYYFDYADSVEVLVLADSLTAHDDNGTIKFTQSNILASVRADANTIYEWSEVGKVVSGKVSLWDYDFTVPHSDLKSTSTVTSGTHSYKNTERYQSNGHYKTADKGGSFYARHVAEAHAANYAHATGLCNTTKIHTGVKFTLDHADRTEVNGSYLVLGCTHFIRFDDGAEGTELRRQNRNVERIVFPEEMALYECEFEVMPSATPYRPLRQTPWPEVPGLLTAVVTGPSGEEIYTDEYGRIKVQFPWDRVGTLDDKSSCWVRAVMPWTGKQWGFVAIPRIGMEVIIQFERGNIDRPICTGMVYDGINKQPYGMPSEMNKLGLRTNSTKGGGGFHELTFDDTKDSESVFFQSEKDYKQLIKNNAEITIGMEKKSDGNLTQTVYKNMTETIKTGDVTQTIEQGNRITKVKTDDTTTVEGKSTTTITGNTALEVKQGNLSEKISTGNMSTAVSMGNISIKADLGKIEVEAMQSIELKVGGSSIKIDQMGITIKGTMNVNVEAPLKVGIKSDLMTSVEGTMTEVKASGILTLNGALTMIN
ncbi:type VI secretion system tip protein VgrG [bacterium]|nr:type VI secretion system tip protein VgrG [bacterium]